MRHGTPSVWTAALLLGLAVPANLLSANLSASTLKAWDQSVDKADRSLACEASDPAHFLQSATDSAPAEHGGMVSVPFGLIHHWIGSEFFPHVSIAALLSVLQDYNSYSQIYQPATIESKLLSLNHQEFVYTLKLVESGFGIKSGLLGEFRARYFQLNDDAGYSVTEASRLVELANVGSDRETQLPQASARGWIERAVTIVRYRKVDSGVYLEIETLTLSRDIPFSLKWIAAPLVQRFSRQVMADTLERLRGRVLQTHSVQMALNK